ncbi:glycosyltransferase family 4 protein [Paenibacillaceae bacterium WGS1546]|uniref:glycosyltransferase family 4 protein n=1 Tax=Cohnella sp. WGS1546 TaxID=3366810 RepID=UPI00372D4B28
MKVLYLTNIPAPYRVDFFNELAESCELTVWFQARNEANRRWAVKPEAMRFRHRFLPGFTLGLDKHVNLSVFKELRASRFDLYVLGCYSSPTEMAAMRWLKAKGFPYLLNSDGGFPAKEEGRLKSRLKRSLISSASGWLTSGSNGAAYLAHYGAAKERIWEYPFSSVAYSPELARPFSKEERESFKRSRGLQARVVLSVGQFIERKGFEDLLASFAPLDNGRTSLVLIGGGPLKAKYERIARERRLRNVLFIDFLAPRELVSFYKCADVFAFPTRYDVWGLVLNEALAFGLPVVTTRGAGAAYSLVEHGVNGFVSAVGDMDGFVRNCRTILWDEALRERFSQASLRKAEAYTVKRMAERHLEAFARCLDSR